MKKLFAATLLSAALCVSQTGSALASMQANIPPIIYEDVDVGSQLHPIFWIIIGGVAVEYLIRAIDKAQELWEEGNAEEACDFYKEYRSDVFNGTGISANHQEEEAFWQLGYDLYSEGECVSLFDDQGNDVDSNGVRLW